MGFLTVSVKMMIIIDARNETLLESVVIPLNRGFGHYVT